MGSNNSINAGKNQQIKSGVDVLNKVQVSSASLNSKHWYDSISNAIADFLTSVLLIMIVTIAFLAGITTHLYAVFNDWFLAIGFQSVVLLTSVNSDLLPKYKNVPIIAVCMSCFTCIFIFLSFDGHLSTGIMLLVNALKSIAVAIVEFIFAYLFVARNNRTKAERAGIKFDFEGNMLTEQSTSQQNDQATETTVTDIVKSSAESHETASIVTTNEHNEHNEQEQHTYKCECNQTFDSKEAFTEHANACDIHKFFNS